VAQLPEIIPIGNMCVVQRKKASDTTKGGIALPDAARETKMLGTVIAVGPGSLRSNRHEGETERYPMQVKVGDKVLLATGTQVLRLDEADPDTELCIAPEHHLLAILK